MKGYIIVNEKDNVATALRDFKKGEKVANIELLNDIASGHKFALKDIKKDEIIITDENELRIVFTKTSDGLLKNEDGVTFIKNN